MRELHNERILLKQVLEEKGLRVFAFEADAGARPETAQAACLDEVANADVYLGLFWNDFSEAVLEEFDCARSLGNGPTADHGFRQYGESWRGSRRRFTARCRSAAGGGGSQCSTPVPGVSQGQLVKRQSCS